MTYLPMKDEKYFTCRVRIAITTMITLKNQNGLENFCMTFSMARVI